MSKGKDWMTFSPEPAENSLLGKVEARLTYTPPKAGIYQITETVTLPNGSTVTKVYQRKFDHSVLEAQYDRTIKLPPDWEIFLPSVSLEERRCICDLHTVLLRSGCQCGGK